MSGNWLDSSKNSNLFIQSYIQGFLDISGGNLLLRNNNLIVTGGDASLNGRLTVTRDASLNGRLFIAGDASLNGRLFVASDASLNGRLFVNSAYVGGTLITQTLISDTSSNSRLGTNTLQSSTGTNNTGAGYNAGTTNITGSNNTFLGATSNTTGSAFNQSTALGYGAQIRGSNQIILGTNTENTVIMGDTSLNGNIVVGMDSSFGGNLIMNGNATISTGTTFTVTGTTTGVFGALVTTSTSNIPSTNTATYGQNWSIIPGTSTSAAYTSVSLSSTGQYVLCASGNSVLVSNNYGTSFLQGLSVPLSTTVTATFFGSSMTPSYVYLLSSGGAGGTYGVLASQGSVGNPMSVAVDTTGVYIPENNYNRLSFISKSNQYLFGSSMSANYIYLIAGTTAGTSSTTGTFGANAIQAIMGSCRAVSVDTTGVYIIDGTNNRLIFVSKSNQYLFGSSMSANYVYLLAGTTTASAGASGTMGVAAVGQAVFNNPWSVYSDSTGVYIADTTNHRVTFISKSNQFLFGSSMSANYIYLIAGNGTGGTGTMGTSALGQSVMSGLTGVCADSIGVYISDTNNNRVTFVSKSNQYAFASSMSANYIYLLAGTTSNTSGTGTMGIAAAGQATIYTPWGIYVDNYGVYIGDYTNNRVTFISKSNQNFMGSVMLANYIYLLAGTTSNTSGTGTMGTAAAGQALLTGTRGVCSDLNGVYITDSRVLFVPFSTSVTLLITSMALSTSISSTGQYQLATANGGSTYLSTNYGTSYNAISIAGITIGAFGETSISSTGQYQIIATSPGSIYVSNNYGTTFTQNIYGASTSAAYTSTSISSTGQYVLASANPGALYLSSNYGSSFITISALSTAAFTSTSVSSTGQYMLTCINGGLTYLSSNYGQTFSANPVVVTTAAYQSTSISSTGQYMMVTSSGTSGSIYLSTNYGQTFTVNPTGAPSSVNYQTSAISSTGKYMIVGANPGALYLSSPPLVSTPTTLLSGMVTMTDLSMSGYLYTPTIVTSQVAQPVITVIYNTNSPVLLAGSTTSPGNNCQGLAVSQTGQYIISCAVVGSGGITYSTDFGKTFTLLPISSGKFCQGAAISATGQYMIVNTSVAGTLFTNNYGSTWSASVGNLPTSLNATCTAISSTGQYIIYASTAGIYLSNNFGNTFTNTGTVSGGSWNGCAMSSTGQYMGVVGGALYLSNDYGSTWFLSPMLPTNVGALDGIRMSSSGQYIIVINQTPNAAFPALCISSNFGSSWTNGGFNSTIATIWGVSISSNGQYMALNINATTNNLYFSNNYGVSFTLSTYSSGLTFVRSSFSNIGFYVQNAQTGRVYISPATVTQSTNTYPFTNIKGYVGFTDASGSSTGADAKALVEINGVGNLTQTYQNTLINTDNYSLYTSGSVLIGQNLNVASDRRIKTNIQDVVDVSALSVIRQLKPKRYNYIDTANRGVQPVWGYIAQEVKAIVDYAVNETTDYVPNIYSLVTISGNTLILPPKTYMVTQYDESGNPLPETEYTDPNMPTTDNFTKNQNETPIQIKLIDIQSKRIIITTIINIQDEQTIIIADDLSQYQKLFLYGQRVTDFNVLDKNAVFTIATAALQEVDLELQETKAQVQELANDLAFIRRGKP